MHERVVSGLLVLLLAMPGSAFAAGGSTYLIDYLRSQTAVAKRLLSLTRSLCPTETFGDIEALIEFTPASVASSGLVAEATRGAMNEAVGLQLEGKSEQALEVICTAVRQRAEAGGMLDLRSFALLNTLAVLLRQSGRAAEARALLEEMLPVARHYPVSAAKRTRTLMNNLATALQMQGYLSQAEQLFRESIDNAERLDQVEPRQIGVDMSNLAMVLDLQDKFEEAEPWHLRVLALRTEAFGTDNLHAAGSFTTLGENLTAQRRYLEAEQALRQGLELMVRRFGDRHVNTTFALDGLAKNLGLQGRFAEALPLSARSVAIRTEVLGVASPYTSMSHYQLSRIELALGQADQALTHARAALDGRLPVSNRERSALSAAGQAYVREGVANAAFQLVRSAWRVLGQAPSDSHAQALHEEAFAAMQRISRSNTAEALSFAAARKIAGRSGFASLVNDLESREERLRGLDTALVNAAIEGHAGADALLASKAEQASLAGEIRALHERLQSQLPSYFDQTREPPLSLGALRGMQDGTPLIGENEAIVVMTPGMGAERGFIWAISREHVAWVELPVQFETLQKHIQHLLVQMDLGGRGVKLQPAFESRRGFDRAAAFELYEQLFGHPHLQQVLGAKQAWIIVAQGVLLATPFNALITASPRGAPAEDSEPAVLRATNWLGLERTLSFLPSVASLSTLRRKVPTARSGATRPLFAMGDPAFMPAEGISAVSQVHALPPLPGTRSEIDLLKRTLRARSNDVLLGAAATETELKRRSQSGELERAKVVVFATHALPAGTASGVTREPALVLAHPQAAAVDDGLLTASEAAQLRFDADWVVLSACHTAGSSTEEGEGLTGFARAFLFAGARSLLVSQWRLEDDSAPLLTSGTLAAARSSSRAEALRWSMRKLMNDTSRDEHALARAHPAVWAPMILLGAE